MPNDPLVWDAQRRLAAVEALSLATFMPKSGLDPKDVVVAIHAACTWPAERLNSSPVGLLVEVAQHKKALKGAADAR